jgi:phthalate 4,5-cis-dihydrodiol dehydrogenase
MSSNRTLGLGFVGLGQAVDRMFQQRDELSRLPFRFAAAAETRPHALEAFRRDFGGEGYQSVEELCRSSHVDVVYVATGPHLHREHTEIAARNGKHVIVEKPMALTLEDCQAMVNTADRHGVKLLAGHTHSFDAPIRKMREVIESGILGDVVQINTWNYNAFNPRPWPTKELQETHGPVLNQGPHQIDIIRQIGGGKLRSLRGTTIWDPVRNCEGGYNCYLEFENGVPATMVYDGRGFFDTAELFWWVHESGGARDPDTNFHMHRRFNELRSRGEEEMERVLEARKELGRYGAATRHPEMGRFWGYPETKEIKNHSFFGLTVVSCERGAIRQSADGLYIYDSEKRSEMKLEREMRGRAAELMDLYEGVVNGRPIFHDGRWGLATLEACLGVLESAKTKKEVILKHQTALGDC